MSARFFALPLLLSVVCLSSSPGLAQESDEDEIETFLREAVESRYSWQWQIEHAPEIQDFDPSRLLDRLHALCESIPLAENRRDRGYAEAMALACIKIMELRECLEFVGALKDVVIDAELPVRVRCKALLAVTIILGEPSYAETFIHLEEEDKIRAAAINAVACVAPLAKIREMRDAFHSLGWNRLDGKGIDFTGTTTSGALHDVQSILDLQKRHEPLRTQEERITFLLKLSWYDQAGDTDLPVVGDHCDYRFLMALFRRAFAEDVENAARIARAYAEQHPDKGVWVAHRLWDLGIALNDNEKQLLKKSFGLNVE